MKERMMDNVKDFFESYQTAHALMYRAKDRFIKVIMSTTKKGVLVVRVVEKIQKANDNLMCDVRMEGNRLVMNFSMNGTVIKHTERIKKAIKPNYTYSYGANKLQVVIQNPTLRDVQETFITLEPCCRRISDNLE